MAVLTRPLSASEAQKAKPAAKDYDRQPVYQRGDTVVCGEEIQRNFRYPRG